MSAIAAIMEAWQVPKIPVHEKKDIYCARPETLHLKLSNYSMGKKTSRLLGPWKSKNKNIKLVKIQVLLQSNDSIFNEP